MYFKDVTFWTANLHFSDRVQNNYFGSKPLHGLNEKTHFFACG